MEQYDIRRVELEDLDGCYELEASCFPEAEAAPRDSIRIRIENFPEGFYVAERNGRIVGMVNSGSTNKNDITDEEFKKLVGHERDGKNMVVFSLAVAPEFQSNGVAWKLMQKFVQASYRLGKEKIMLICKENMIDYYERLGFVCAGKSESTHGGADWHEMALELKYDEL